MKCLAGRVIVEPLQEEEQEGFYIPTEKQNIGKIIATGIPKLDEPIEVKVGDTVIYGKYSGIEITVEGKELLIMKQQEILAFL